MHFHTHRKCISISSCCYLSSCTLPGSIAKLSSAMLTSAPSSRSSPLLLNRSVEPFLDDPIRSFHDLSSFHVGCIKIQTRPLYVSCEKGDQPVVTGVCEVAQNDGSHEWPQSCSSKEAQRVLSLRTIESCHLPGHRLLEK